MLQTDLPDVQLVAGGDFNLDVSTEGFFTTPDGLHIDRRFHGITGRGASADDYGEGRQPTKRRFHGRPLSVRGSMAQ